MEHDKKSAKSSLPLRQARLISSTKKGLLELDCGGGVLCRIVVVDAYIIRVAFLRDGTMRQPKTWMVLDSMQEGGKGVEDMPWEGRDRLNFDTSHLPGTSPIKIKARADEVTLETEAILLTVHLSPFGLSWATAGGEPVAQDRASRPYTLSSSKSSSGRRVSHAMQRQRSERFMGLGDKTGALDLHGRRLRTVMTDALGYDPMSGDPLYKHWPFLLAHRQSGEGSGVAYGILYDNMSAATFDLGCEHSNYYGLYRTYEAEDGDLDYYFMLGPGIRQVTARFGQLTGHAPLFPRWTLGYHCTAMPLADAPNAQVCISEFIDKCVAHRIPCSAFHFGSGYTSINGKRYVFNWNHGKFPDPRALIAKFKSAGMRVVANLKPCLLDDHPRFDEVAKLGAFVWSGTPGNPSMSQFWDGEGAHLDFTNKAAIKWWQNGLRKSILSFGIDSAWNDNNEYEIWDDDAECEGFGEASPIALVRPVQSLLMTRASYEEQLRHKPDERPYTVTRAGTPGIQRYAQTWSGDNTTSWETLRWNLRTGLTMSISGMSNIGHDVGGFAGPSPDPELFVRWVQTGLLHPRFIMNSWKADGTVTTPWMYPTATAYARWAIRLRYRLMPYLYTLLWRSSQFGEPILRPTFFEFDQDLKAFDENDELMLGPSILAAPVVVKGARERTLYLPKGMEGEGWYEFYSGEYLEGGLTVTVAAPLERLPLFCRAPSMLFLTDETEDFGRTHEEPTRCLVVFAPSFEFRPFSFAFYEDDGLSFAFRAGASKLLTFVAEATVDEVRVSVEVKDGGRDELVGGGSGNKPFALPFEKITVALPFGDPRKLVVEADGGGSRLALVAGQFRLHAL